MKKYFDFDYKGAFINAALYGCVLSMLFYGMFFSSHNIVSL